jgi:hypothetical protein
MIENYNPNVLTCLASLSNDEVFTPPNIANQMLDLLPADIWKDKNATFLDPKAHRKEGIFEVKALHFEPGVVVDDALVAELKSALQPCPRFA